MFVSMLAASSQYSVNPMNTSYCTICIVLYYFSASDNIYISIFSTTLKVTFKIMNKGNVKKKQNNFASKLAALARGQSETAAPSAASRPNANISFPLFSIMSRLQAYQLIYAG